MPKDEETAPSPARFFGTEVREARKRAGMAQPELAAIAGYDPSYVSKVENSYITPDEKFISACDTAFPDMHGWFSRFWAESRKWNPTFPMVRGMDRRGAAGARYPLVGTTADTRTSPDA